MSALGVPLGMWFTVLAPVAGLVLVTGPLLWFDFRRGYRLVRVREPSNLTNITTKRRAALADRSNPDQQEEAA